MKKKLLVVMALIIMAICSGCFNDPVKSDLEAYVKFEQSANKEMSSFSAEFIAKANVAADKAEKLRILNEGMQKMLAIAEKQKAYEPKTPEVIAIHNKALSVLNITLGMFDELIQALETDSLTPEQLNGINRKQQEINRLTTEYNNEVKALLEKKK
ncbi:hypothetical protein [Azotosporobacter soli]|uniref:hypothetical protein n=1 Tax=Azotosporobacter soli TaxID=3055040 RepID=UPI0031FF3F24